MDNQLPRLGYRYRSPTAVTPIMRIRLCALMNLVLVCGCFKPQPASPVFVAPQSTIEIFATSASAGPNTKTATDPTSGATVHLVTPPFITNADISGVARSDMGIETVGGSAPSTTIPTLEVELNAAGTPKMLNATTNPASPSLAFAVNGTVISIPNIMTPINGSFRITGDHTDPAYINAITAVTGQSN